MSDFDELLTNLKEIRQESSDPQKYLAHLLEIQNRSKYINFQKLTSEKISSIFDDFWLFLLYASSHSSNPSVRITAIRAAAFFILNLQPFYPNELQTSFSNIATVSTIDIEASSLIAAIFGIISYHISTPYRNKYLQSCPIFHHITESNSYQDHFIYSLSHYSHLGIEFHRTLIRSFLTKNLTDPSDKIYWHAIIEIVTFQPDELFLEVFNSLIENDYYKERLQFMSCLLAIPNSPINSVNLFEIAKYSLTVLSDFSNGSHDLTYNEQCAVCTILSLKTNSFYVECRNANDGFLLIRLSDSIQSNLVEKKCKIESLKESPEFYSLQLPPELAFPNGGDGSSLLAAKMTLLITYLDSDNVEIVTKILNVIKSYMTKPYDTTVSACFQAISNSVGKLKKYDVLYKIENILGDTFFQPSISWFHDMDRLKVIEALPLDSVSKSLGTKFLLSAFDQVLIWAKEKNDKLASYAQQVLVNSFIMQSDSEILLAKVIKTCDLFDQSNLVRTLEILNLYFQKSQLRVKPEILLEFCKQILQLFAIYPNNPDIYIQLLKYATNFHVKKLRTKTIHICVAVVIATYNMITGMNAINKEISESLVEQQYKMIESVTSKQSMDIIKENLNDYSSYVPHLYATLKFLISVQKIDIKYVNIVIQYTIDLFPFEASHLMYKHWNFFPQVKRTSLLANHFQIVKNACGFKCAGIWFEMYMKTAELIPDSPSIFQSVAAAPFGYACRDSFLSVATKNEFSDAYDFLKEFLNMSMDYVGQIGEKIVLYYIHFYKYVYPTKQFDFNLIPEEKRARVISLINRIPLKNRKKKTRSFSPINLNNTLSSTISSSAPIYEGVQKSDSSAAHPSNLPIPPSNLHNNDASHTKDDQDSNLIQFSDTEDKEKENEDNEKKFESSESGSESGSESNSESDSGSIALPTSIEKSGSDSLVGSDSSFSSANISSAGSMDFSPFVSASQSCTSNSFGSSLLSGFDSPVDYENASRSSSTLDLFNQLDIENDMDGKDTFGVYVPIETVFEPPKITTMNQLSDKLPINDPLVEVQLRHGTYDFDDDELNELYDYYSKTNNSKIIELIFKYAKKNEIQLNAKDESNNNNESAKNPPKIPEKINKKYLIQLCRYLNDNYKPPINQTSNNEDSSNNDLEEKEEMINIEYISKLLNCIQESTKEIKIKYLLFTLGNIFSTYSKIDFNLAKLVISNFNENFNKLPINELGSCIESLCKKVVKKGRPKNFLKKMQSIIPMTIVGGHFISNSLGSCRLIQVKDISVITQKYLQDKSLPSSFREVILLLTILTKDPNINVIDLLNSNIQPLINVCKNYKRNEPVHRQVAIFFNSTFREKYYESFGKSSIIALSTFQFPMNSVLSTYSICIPRFIKLLMSNSKINYEFKDTKIIFFCKEYFELMNVEIQSVDDKRGFVLKKIEVFIESIDKGRVCIQKLDDYIFHWFVFLNQFFKFDGIYTRIFPLAKFSFISFFLGVLRFIKFHKKDVTQEEFNKISQCKIKAHSMAYKYALTNDKHMIEAGIKLALFEQDCEDSDYLIKRCEKYYNRTFANKS